jgi:hypothetical protein
MGHKIYRIDEFRAGMRRCFCNAARSRQEFLEKELLEFRLDALRPSLLQLESLEGGIPAGSWDFIYSTELLSGLPQPAARQVIKALVSHLKPGGRLLIGNIKCGARLHSCSGCPNTGHVDRSELEMADLIREVPDSIIAGQVVFADPAALNVYLELYKTAASASRVA